MTQKKNKQESEPQLIANRYNRQELIKGWNQSRIRKSTIAVIGSETLANFTLTSLVSLGFGNVEIYDNQRVKEECNNEFLLNLAEAKLNDSKVEALERILSKINPLVRVKGIHTKIDSAPMTELLEQSGVIIDTTNDIKTKTVTEQYATKRKIPFISASADLNKGQLNIRLPNKKYEENNLKAYEGKKQGAIPSEVLGGIITEEVRKIIMPFKKGESSVKSLVYSSASPLRFSDKDETEAKEYPLNDKHVLIIGAGALGNFAGIGLASAGVGRIDILDFDNVETTNLNRQLLFYDAVGQKKSKALAYKLRIINPRIKIKGLIGKLDENCDYFEKNQPDLILDCVDNFTTRAIVNYFAIKHKTPLVSGGTSPSSGQVIVYKPGYSACLDCKLGVDKALVRERTSHSCIYAAQPSVIMTNEIIGGLMVAEAKKVLASESYGEPIKKMLKYDSTNLARAGLLGGDMPCNCQRPSIKKWLTEVTTKYSLKA